MTRAGLLLLVAVATAPNAWAGASGWQRDWNKASASAEKSSRPLIVEFTRDDASAKINERIFSKPAFQEIVRRHNAIPVEINYSRKVSRALERQYAELKERYAIQSYPTVLILDYRGRVQAKMPDGAEGSFVDWLKKLDEVLPEAHEAGFWMTDWDEAKKLSRKERKPMLVFFTGSDW